MGTGFQIESHGIRTCEADESVTVILSNADTDGHVIVDAVQFIVPFFFGF